MDHLSRLEELHENILEKIEINDAFPGEKLYSIWVVREEETPWFTDFANYLVVKSFLKWLTYQQRKKFFTDLKYYIWEDLYHFKIYSDQVVRRCVLEWKGKDILRHCHSGPTGDHYSRNRTTKNIMDASFYWTSMFQDA